MNRKETEMLFENIKEISDSTIQIKSDVTHIRSVQEKHDKLLYGNGDVKGIKTEVELLRDSEKRRRKLGWLLAVPLVAWAADYFANLRFR